MARSDLASGVLMVVGLAGLVVAGVGGSRFGVALANRNPELVPIEDIARQQVGEGRLVRVEGVADPRWRYAESLGERLIEVRLILPLDEGYQERLDALGEWREGWLGLCRSFRDERPEDRDIAGFEEWIQDFEVRWGQHEEGLTSAINGLWPASAVGFQVDVEDEGQELFLRDSESEHPWRFAGAPERVPVPAYPEAFEYPADPSAAQIRRMRRQFRTYHDGQRAWYEAACQNVVAELGAFDPAALFGEDTVYEGVVRRMNQDPHNAFTAVTGTAIPIYFTLVGDEEADPMDLALTPGGLLLALIGLGGWAARRRGNRFEDFADGLDD